MGKSQQQRFIVTCPKGIAPFLQAEIESLGYKALQRGHAAIELVGETDALYRLNLWLRCAHRVLLFVASGVASTAADLYRWAVNLPWEDHILPSRVVTVTASVQNDSIRNSLYACQKLKDAIADRLRNRLGQRPNSDGRREGVVIFLYWRNEHVSVYVDTSGIPLSKRGYRKNPAHAPLSETLAAAILYATKWRFPEALVLPMCGSGTLAIEAAFLAQNIPPSLHRTRFAFMQWRGYQPECWDNERERARATISGATSAILACDNDAAAIEAAKENARAALVEQAITFFHCDYQHLPLPAPPATVIVNPPYGVRIGEEQSIPLLYKQLGDWFKHACTGMRGFVLTTLENAKHIGLRPRRRHLFFNADIECRLLEFELYSGSKPSRSGDGVG
ncbi:MAG: RNA methyltransferase [Candidatus Kapaibacterium sp.]|nr:MAG: RNA methyltransferase [Candidatus Kapabacteria bacterium]